MKAPALRAGHEYLSRYAEGARSVADLDPDMGRWIAQRCRRRGWCVVLVLVGLLSLMGALIPLFAGTVVRLAAG